MENKYPDLAEAVQEATAAYLNTKRKDEEANEAVFAKVLTRALIAASYDETFKRTNVYFFHLTNDEMSQLTGEYDPYFFRFAKRQGIELCLELDGIEPTGRYRLRILGVDNIFANDTITF